MATHVDSWKAGLSVALTAIVALTMCPLSSFAEKDSIPEADSLMEYIDASAPDFSDTEFTVDKKTGETDRGSFEETFGEAYPGEGSAEEVIDASGEYSVSEETKTTYEVTSLFGTKRLVVSGKPSELYGATDAIHYDGETLLTYDTEDETKEAYARYVESLGEDNVIVDIPVKATAKGWGTAFMNLDKKSSALASASGSVTVAVLDTGIDKAHEIFAGKTVSQKSYDLVNSDSDPADDNGHGTMTSGIIAESTPENVQLMAIKMLNNEGRGSTVTMAQAIRYAAENGADVINCSLGGKVESNTARYLDQALLAAESAGAVIVSASGNESANMDTTTYYPCESPYSLCVGAIDKDKTRPYFSNYGENLDFCAPGSGLSVALLGTGNGYETESGTSFSCPYISACAALVRLEKGKLTRTQVSEELKKISVDIGDEGKDRYYGYGYPKFSAAEPPVTTSSETQESTTASSSASATASPTTRPQPSTTVKPTTKPITTNSKDIRDYSYTIVYGSNIYTGKPITPKVTLGSLRKGIDYTVSYMNNIYPGQATITLRGIGAYTGTRTIHFTIKGKVTTAPAQTTKRPVTTTTKKQTRPTKRNVVVPGKPSISKAKWKKVGKKYRITVRWKKVPNASGYEVQIRSVKKTKKGQRYKKDVRLGGTWYAAPKKFRKSAKKGSVVKVRVRAYNNAGSGKWSEWKRVGL